MQGQQQATLGDVLYAGKSKSAAPEKDWVDLVRAVAADDPLALHALYDRTHRIVFTLLMRITGSQEAAEELTVEVFYDVCRRAASYNPSHGTVVAWIMSQARARAMERVRYEQEREHPDLLMTRSHGQALRVALTTLSADERHAIEAAFLSDSPPAGLDYAHIRSGLHKLRQVLART